MPSKVADLSCDNKPLEKRICKVDDEALKSADLPCLGWVGGRHGPSQGQIRVSYQGKFLLNPWLTELSLRTRTSFHLVQ